MKNVPLVVQRRKCGKRTEYNVAYSLTVPYQHNKTETSLNVKTKKREVEPAFLEVDTTKTRVVNNAFRFPAESSATFVVLLLGRNQLGMIGPQSN